MFVQQHLVNIFQMFFRQGSNRVSDQNIHSFLLDLVELHALGILTLEICNIGHVRW